MKIIILLNIFFIVSCTSINVRFKPKVEHETSFTHYTHYGFMGLIGSDTLYFEKLCINSNPVRVKNYFSSEDMLFAFFTFGIYTPKSTKIWCEPLIKESL